MKNTAEVISISPRKKTMKEVLATFFANYDAPFNQTSESSKAIAQGYFWAVEGKTIALVELVVKDFVTGKVERKASSRSKLPTAEEFATRLAARAATAETATGEAMTHAPVFGPLWGVRLYALLLAGPDRTIKPSAFMAMMIAKGGSEGESYRLHHQAQSGFKSVNAMMQSADEAKGCMAPTALVRLMPSMEAVPVGCEVFMQWREEHERRGWPWLPDTGKQRVVYFPIGGPKGLNTFEEAMREGGSKV